LPIGPDTVFARSVIPLSLDAGKARFEALENAGIDPGGAAEPHAGRSFIDAIENVGGNGDRHLFPAAFADAATRWHGFFRRRGRGHEFPSR